jgi:hypothetical protein
MSTTIKVRRGDSNSWSTANPVLAAGESGFETDTKKIKIGNGSTAWNSLSYVRLDGGSLDEVLLTTTSEANFAGTSGTQGAFFRVLNRGGNWNEFFANWQNSWMVVGHPEFNIVNVVQDLNEGEPDTLLITISGGVFQHGVFYSFIGPKG